MARPVAFVHVDLDNTWAIADCYGADLAPEHRNFVYENALPRFAAIFGELKIRSTLFVVGRDLEIEGNAARLRSFVESGHQIGNHSQTHELGFRDLTRDQIILEVSAAEAAISQNLGVTPRGFRAPGYGVSANLISVLIERGYQYDSSIMPSPYGFVFRWLDGRLRRKTPRGRALKKTQFPLLTDAQAPLHTYRVSTAKPTLPDESSTLFELPVATSPLLRLPFQASVCQRLGMAYFRRQLAAFRQRPELPLTFLLHGADLTDFAAMGNPFFAASAFFARPVADKAAEIRAFLGEIAQSHNIVLAEDWLAESPSAQTGSARTP
ncbi:MAG: polysaccharide deacetylase family protein [Candidatus Sumerlaeaceae bacterium]|nr:polysaccharide deacetylase family protein [Candidatus Sumerlaeaceae bacterium]